MPPGANQLGGWLVRHLLPDRGFRCNSAHFCQSHALMPVPRVVAGRGALVFALLALGAIAASLYLCGPGWMASDSGNQLTQARSFAFRDDNPVLMALLWHFTDRVVPGPRGMLILMTSSYWVGLACVFWALPGPLLARALGFILLGFYPPVFSIVPVIWKDELMQAALVMGLGCVAIDARRWRPALQVLGALFFVVAIGARHNGPVAVWPLLAYPLLQANVLSRWRPWLRWLTAMSAALVLTLALSLGLRRTLAPITEETEFWQFIPAFDLAGMSLEEDKVVIDRKTGLLTPGMGVNEIRRFYDPEYMNRLYYCIWWNNKPCVHVFNRTRDPEKLARLQKNWLSAIGRHPVSYLKHRYKVSAALLGIEGGAGLIYMVEYAPFSQFGSDYPPPKRTLKLLTWIEGQVKTLWFHPWLYFGMNCALLPLTFLLYLRRGWSLPLQCAVSGFIYMCSLFISAGSSDYRYTVWTTLSTLLAAAATAASVYAAARVRREAASVKSAPDGAPGDVVGA
jgi:hypothetical protein